MRKCQKRPIIRQKRPTNEQKRPIEIGIPEGGRIKRETNGRDTREQLALCNRLMRHEQLGVDSTGDQV